MAHLHSVTDLDPRFDIDSESRVITYLSDDPLVLIQGDHNSERITFEMPRYIEGHDMMECNLVQVHYINLNANNSSERNIGVYEVTDLQLDPEDDETVVCSWLVSQNATLLVGSLNFVLRFACTTGSKIDYSWSTAVYSGITISTGIVNESLIVEQYTDVLQNWYLELLAAGSMGVNIVEDAKNKALDDIQLAAEEQIANVTDSDAFKEVEDELIASMQKAGEEVVSDIRATEASAVNNVRNAETQMIESAREELIADILARLPVAEDVSV